jgi:hypothetical protein
LAGTNKTEVSTESTIGTKIFSRKPSSGWAVAARGARIRGGGVVQAVAACRTGLASRLAKLVLVGTRSTSHGLCSTNGALVSERAQQARNVTDISSARRAEVAGQTQASSINSAIEGAVVATCTIRAVSDISQTSGRRVGSRWALYWSIAANRTVVTGRANVVDCGVECLHTSLADVTDLIVGFAALMRSSNRAAAATEESFLALRSRSSEARSSTVRTRCALCALTCVNEAGTITECADGTQVLSRKSSAVRAVAARRTNLRSRGVVQAVAACRTDLRNSLSCGVLVGTSLTNGRLSAAKRTVSASGANVRNTLSEVGSTGGAVVANFAFSGGEHCAVEGAVVATNTRRTFSDVSQTCRGRVSAGRTLYWSIAANRTVVTGRTNVVDGGVECLHASLANVTDLIIRSTALVRSSNRAAAATEESFLALRSGSSEARSSTVRARGALCALTCVNEAGAITECADGTQVLSRKSSAIRAIAARRTNLRSRGIVQAEASGRANLRAEQKLKYEHEQKYKT